ncbi:hypothetical protein ACIPL1_25480 [Pseudomonas sp. NPDC090202]|uniref:hypothetical protein n=1 Tax=unclassified Pseudomonas TaxID=196821 RepID=UPI0038293365
MNVQPLARLRISPLHVQQGLFASLALLVTLIVVQQFNHWHQAQEVAPVQHAWSHSAPLARAAALSNVNTALSLQSVEDAAAAIDEAPRQQSWVF